MNLKLRDVFNYYGVPEHLEMKIAYLLAYYGELVQKVDEDDDGEEVDVNYLDEYDFDQCWTSEYGLQSGCYSNHMVFSLETIIRCLVDCDGKY